MAERVVDIEFVTQVKDPHVVRERASGGKVPRLLWTAERPHTVVHDGPYMRITGTACTIKVSHANIAYMVVEEVPDEAKKAGGK